VQEGRPRRRYPALPYPRPACRYHPPWPRGTGCRPGRATGRSHPRPRRRPPPGKKKDPQLVEALKGLVEPVTGGEPMSPAKYVRRSLQALSDELAGCGHAASPTTVAALLRDLDYHLYVNVKRFTGPYHRDRDQQFRYVQALIGEFRAEGLPILSTDSKNKELVGTFANAAAAWRQEADEVNAHDFLSDGRYRAVPYALYHVLPNRGQVIVGTSADTPQFAAEAV